MTCSRTAGVSFAAVAAVHGLAPAFRSRLEGTFMPLRLCTPLAISLACTLATAPVALVHFGRTSLVASLSANLLALPAVAPLLWLALASCLLWPVAPGATVVLDAAVRALGAYIGAVARLGAWLDGALPGRALLIGLTGGTLVWLAIRRPAAAFAGSLAMMGLLKETYRLPIVPVTPATRAKLKILAGELGLLV